MCFESTATAKDTTSKRALIIRYNRAAISLRYQTETGQNLITVRLLPFQGLFFPPQLKMRLELTPQSYERMVINFSKEFASKSVNFLY